MNFSKARITARSLFALKNFIRNRSSTTALDAEPTKISTLDEKEISKHVSIADEWWDEQGELKALHSMNKLRIQLVREGLIRMKTVDPSKANGPNPLDGVQILDVGCGGGILSEPLARIGAAVTGIDPGQKLIDVAVSHAAEDPSVFGKVKYLCESVEDHSAKNKEKYDAVVASEVIEHVVEKELFLESCSNVLKELISLIEPYKIQLDTAFFNVLIKRRISRKEDILVKDCLKRMHALNLKPDLLTFETLAHSCNTYETGMELLQTIHNHCYRANCDILTILLKRASYARDIKYVHAILQAAKEDDTHLNAKFLALLSNAVKKEQYLRRIEREDAEKTSNANNLVLES